MVGCSPNYKIDLVDLMEIEMTVGFDQRQGLKIENCLSKVGIDIFSIIHAKLVLFQDIWQNFLGNSLKDK